jgi:hypothetical protein
MRRLTVIGLVLIVLGILAFVFPRITYTQDQTTLDLGPVSVQAKKQRTVSIPDIAAGAAVAAGTVMVLAGARRRQ